MAWFLAAGACLLGAGASSGVGVNASPAHQPPDGRFQMVKPSSMPSVWPDRILHALGSLSAPIDRVFKVSMPVLRVHVYPSHSAFAQSLHGQTGLWPEGLGDNLGNVVEANLLVGPSLLYLRHRLAHVYTEWVLDTLTNNWSGAEPRPAWLYDGLAEIEAQDVASMPGCRLHGRWILPLSGLASPRQWWRIRGSPLAGVEYCEAESAAGRIVRRLGWERLVGLLRQAHAWQDFARGVSFVAMGNRPQ